MTQKASSANPGPEPPYILALDVGTSSTRALLFDATGNTLPNVLAQRRYQLTISNEGEVSVDPDTLVAVVERTIDDVLETAGPLAQHIGAVAIDTFWHGLMGVDADNRPLTPLILWEDTHPHDAAVELRKQLDEAAIHARTGARFHASYWPAKLRWLATQAPGTFSRVAQWFSFGDYLYRHFLGRSVCSLSMASGTGLLQTRARAWDAELMNVLDVRPEQFPPLGDLHERVQGLTPKYASAWPALRNVPWFPATGDGAAQRGRTAPRIIGSGGALLGSMTLKQILADTLGVAVYPSRDHEASARGAALLALEAMGILPDVAQVPPSLEQPVKPDAEKHAVYRKAAERQQKLYQELLEGKAGSFPNSS